MIFFEELQYRGFIDNYTHSEVIEMLNKKNIKFYIGFDPSSDSFHIGQLPLFFLMGALQRQGHQPIALMGGATGMIGDPSGKKTERKLLTKEELEYNISKLSVQLEKFLNFQQGQSTVFVNNYEWFQSCSYLDILRDVGKHFSVNTMMQRDAVKTRLQTEGSGISYTEFSYAILQSYDFYMLHKQYECSLQIGGADQWGNIVAGIDLIRRLSQKQTYGLTIPLVTNKDGTKFGKSEAGTIWLDESKTSPYNFYQFFVRQDDQDVIPYIKLFTDLSIEEIEDLEISLQKEPHLRKAQQILARKVTQIVHGTDACKNIEQASQFFYGQSTEQPTQDLIEEIFLHTPSYQTSQQKITEGWQLVEALVDAAICSSKSQARQLIQSGGLYINNVKTIDMQRTLTINDCLYKKFIFIRKGKKNYNIIKFI